MNAVPVGPKKRLVSAGAMEESADIIAPSLLVARRLGCRGQWKAGRQTEKSDRIKEVGLSDTIGPRDSGERAEAHIHPNEVLEPIDFQSGQRGICSAVRVSKFTGSLFPIPSTPSEDRVGFE